MLSARQARRGVALVEVLVATALLGAAGVAFVQVAREAAATLDRLEQRDLEAERVTLALTAALALHSGGLAEDRTHVVHGHRVSGREIEPGLFELTVRSPDSDVILVRTYAYTSSEHVPQRH